MSREPCVYILASRPGGATYVGVTSDLARRVEEHRQGRGSRFTSRYRIRMLVWYEWHETMIEAIEREKELKKWERAKKSRLIAEVNPTWRDLYEELA
ncbi:MAG: GIY-YIG nuclease family protein [Chloroflexota bacterium]|nr:GIY-YIG nuclease family protein [Chloroflexota bacterium]